MHRCLVLLMAALVAQISSERDKKVHVAIDRHAHAQGGNRSIGEVKSRPSGSRNEYSSGWPNIKWGTDKVCCCTDPGEDQKCYWQEKIRLDTGSGCNLVGAFNPFAEKKRISGFTDAGRQKFFIFDVRKYGSKKQCEVDDDTCAANEIVYKSKCEVLQGSIALISDAHGGKHQYIVNSDFFQELPPAVKAEPDEDEEVLNDGNETVVTPQTPTQDLGDVNAIVSDPMPPGADEDPVEDPSEVRKTEILGMLAERQLTALQESLTNSNLKKCERNKQSPFRMIFCSKVCDMWPPMPVNSRTGVRPPQNRKGCHSIAKESFSNAKKYCKNACQGEQEGGDCTTPSSMPDVADTARPCGK